MALNPAKEKFCLLMAEGYTQARASREVGRTKGTVCQWMKEAEVQDRIAELRTDLTSQAIVLLRDNVVNNTQIILDIAKYGGEPGVVPSRLKAAIWALEKVLKPAMTGEGREEDKAFRDIAKELEASSDSELDELLDRGRPISL